MVEQQSEPRFRSKYPRPKRDDGRVQFLAFLPPDLVQRLKGAANDRNEYAYQIVERVVRNALDRLGDRVQLELDWPVPVEADTQGLNALDSREGPGKEA